MTILITENIITNIYDSAALYPYKKKLSIMTIPVERHCHNHNIQFKFCDFYQIKLSTVILITENIMTTIITILLFYVHTRKS